MVRTSAPIALVVCVAAGAIACDRASSEDPPAKAEPAKAEPAKAKQKAKAKDEPVAKKREPEPPPVDAPTPKKGSRAAPAHKLPKGTIGGHAFAPDTVLLVEDSDGAHLVFAQRNEKRERWRCEEPLGAELSLSLYRAIADWSPSAPVEAELSAWGMSGIDSLATPAGTARITLTKKSASEFALAGSIELAASDGTWKFAGDFVGEYCPTKAVERETAEPLAGLAWGLGAVAADALPNDPIAAVIAGKPTRIAHVTAREVDREGQKRTQLVFFAEPPPEPCAARPEGGGLTTYADDGSIASRDVAAYRVDSFRLELASAPAKGDRLVGRVDGNDPDARTQIADADLQVFEPDGYRSWKYWQYYSAALAVDDVSDERVSARVYLAIPDDGKSMLVGAFTAQRCPALP